MDSIPPIKPLPPPNPPQEKPKNTKETKLFFKAIVPPTSHQSSLIIKPSPKTFPPLPPPSQK